MVEYDVSKIKTRVFKKLKKKYLTKENFNFVSIKVQSEPAAKIF
jgi:hypothetical protein